MDDALPMDPEAERKHARAARDKLRRWMSLDPNALSLEVGRQAPAIRQATDVIARLSRIKDVDASTNAVLGDVLRAVFLLDEGARRAPWWSLRRYGPRTEFPDLGALPAKLERQRDIVDLTLVTLRSDRLRLLAAADALIDAVHEVRILDRLTEAAGREVRSEDVRTSRVLVEQVLPALVERQSDLLSHLVVTQQAVSTLDLVISTRERLSAALRTAGAATLSAVRTAIAARKAVASAGTVESQTEILRRSGRDIGSPNESALVAARRLEDAISEARALLGGVAPGSDWGHRDDS